MLAVRRPDLVSGIITLGSPLKHQLAVHPLVRASILGIGVLGTAGLDGLMRHSCLWGDCCTEYWEHFGRDFPSGLGFVSIYSRTDGIVKWKACLDPAAEHVEVRASHIGMAVNAEVYGAIAASLEGLRTAEALKAANVMRKPAQRRHLRLAA